MSVGYHLELYIAIRYSESIIFFNKITQVASMHAKEYDTT
jgi:hypothetical protein